MENSKTIERLAPAINHKYDWDKMFALERERNRKHHAKFKDSIRASRKRRMAQPKHQASAKAMARVGWLMRHPDFSDGKFPKSTSFAITYEMLLGTSATVFREHMGVLFHSGMTWRNYGTLWHIGHRIPVRLFDCSDPMQLKACFHYMNLQPELSEENLRRMNEVVG